MKLIFPLMALAFLAACTTAPVYLKHMETGQVVTCGPYDNRPLQAASSAYRESQCITDYQRQGFERTPTP